MTPPPRPLDTNHLIRHLQQENQRLAALVQQQQQALEQRAEPQAVAVLDMLEAWCGMAEQPGHPAQAAAANLLKRWAAVSERAKSAAASIVVAVNLPPNGRGS